VTPTKSETPTRTGTPTLTNSFVIIGCVVHASGCGGSQEYGTVHLEPTSRTAEVDRGFFRFENVPAGAYTMRYSPGCNPSGCTRQVDVTVVDRDVEVGFYRSNCAADCSIDSQVHVDELLQCITGALDGSSGCSLCDADMNGEIAVDDLMLAVNSALTGCR
jgi:hypothetical protein